MKRTKFIGTALAVMMALSLTACGGNNNTTTGGANSPGTQVTPSVTPTPNSNAGNTASVRSTNMSRARNYAYYATDNGQVTDSTTGNSNLARDAKRVVDDTGNAVRDAAQDVARGARNVVDDMTGR